MSAEETVLPCGCVVSDRLGCVKPGEECEHGASLEKKWVCACCENFMTTDDFSFQAPDEDGWCKECAQAAKDTADYRAWVNRGG